MVWKSRANIISFLLFSMLNFTIHAYQIVPFIPKDKSSNLLFQSSDDQVRYLLQNQNMLSLVEAAKSTPVHKADAEIVQYEVLVSSSKRHILVSLDDTPFINFDPRKNKKLFWGTYKGSTLNFLGEGSMPQLHLNDLWVSYFNGEKKSITFESLLMLGKNSYKISLNNKHSPYFIPEISMIGYEEVLYTDLNEKGEVALILYNLKSKSFSFIHKTVGAGKKISFCQLENEILLAEFDLYNNPQVSIYSLFFRGDQTFSEKKNYYNSNGKFLPKLLCSLKEKSLFLLKENVPSDKQRYSNQSILINISIPKINVLEISYDRTFAQLFMMDERVLLQSSGRIYQVVK